MFICLFYVIIFYHQENIYLLYYTISSNNNTNLVEPVNSQVATWLKFDVFICRWRFDR